MQIEYLSALVSKPTSEWELNLDLSSLQGKTQAVQLWNITVKLSEISQNSSELLYKLGKIRLHACRILQEFVKKKDMTKYWLCTAKAFLDCGDFKNTEDCLKKIDLDIVNTTEKFNFFLWSTQMLFLEDKEFFSSLKETLMTCKELPNEKFRLARFVYVEVCKKLQGKKMYHEMAEVLTACLEISQGGTSEPLRQIYEQSKLLLCECLIEIGRLEKAIFLLEEIGDCSEKSLLSVKLMIYTNRFDDLQKLIRKMVSEACMNTLEIAVDLLVSKNKLVDACKCLQIITEKYKSFDLLLKWFKILFALETAYGTDSNLDYLDTEKVVFLLLSLKHKNMEYEKLLWDYIIELYSTQKITKSLKFVKKYFLPVSSEKLSALLFAAQCYLDLSKPHKAKNMLKDLEKNGEVLGLLIRADIQLGEFSVITSQVLLTLPVSETIKVLQVVKEVNFVLFENCICGLSEKLMNLMEKTPEKMEFLKWLCEHDPDLLRKTKYFELIFTEVTENLDYFSRRAWNIAVAIEDRLVRLDLMVTSVKLLEKAQLTSTNTGLYILLTTCSEVILTKSQKFYDLILNIIHNLPDQLISEEFKLLEFEFSLLLNIPINLPTVEPQCFHKLAMIAKEHGHYDCTKHYLEKSLQFEFTCEALRELIKTSSSFEESEKYLQTALENYSELTNSEEIDWIVAYAWNNGTQIYNTSNDIAAKKWMGFAVEISEKCKHVLSPKILNFYNEIL